MNPTKRQLVVTTQFPPKESIDSIAEAMKIAKRYGRLTAHIAPNGGINAITLEEVVVLKET